MKARLMTFGVVTAVATWVCLPAAWAADAASPADTQGLNEVLGDASAWQIAPAAPTLSGAPGRRLLAGPAGQALSLESKQRFASPAEYTLAFRLKPTPAGGASVSLQMASGPRLDTTQGHLAFSVSAAAGQKHVNYSASVQGGTAAAVNGALYFEAVAERSLAWPEELRRIVEAQIAGAPKVEETLFTVRCTVEPTRFRAWLNGRFLSEISLEPGVASDGVVKLQVSPNAELLSVRVRPLDPLDRRWEPLSIDGHLTASTIAGKRIDRSSLASGSSAGRLTPIAGVPFMLPAPSAEGSDHIDVGASWTRFGALPGYIAANFGPLGGRWISADRIDPSRLAMYVPRGRYKALHLIAAADGEEDSVPIVTAQFYRPNAGHPINFPGKVPELGGWAGDAEAVGVTTADGQWTRLFHVTIPLDPDAFSWFSDLNRIGLELTKQVQFYRAYPDPQEFSWHGAGLPSSVHIYAATLERVGADIDIQPDQFGHVWTAPAAPRYTVELRNATGAATTATLSIETRSEDGKDMTRQERKVALPADGATVKVPITLKPTRYGLHELALTLASGGGGGGGEQATYYRHFAYLHEDTRERGNWEQGKGSIFGFWPWGGGHDTPTADKEIAVMAAAGAETSTANYSQSPPEVRALAEKHKFIGESAFHGGPMYFTGFYSWYPGAPKWDPADPEGNGKALVEALRKYKAEPGPVSRPTYLPFFAEPHIGNVTTGIWPSHYGDEYTLSKQEQATFQDMLAKYLAGARAIRKEWPDIKLLLPYGDPMNAAVFLRLTPESRDLIDGSALDLPGFERLPEQQINQVVLHRMYPIFKDIKQHLEDPYFVLIEGTHVSSKDIDTGMQDQADISMRNFLVLMGYGITRFASGNSPFDCADYWGENHYGGGWNTRLPVAMPKPAYVQYATITRNLNRANFTRYVPTGSTSTFFQQFKHYKTGAFVHVLWTVRGTRPVTIEVPAGATLELYDRNDNVTVLREKNGAVTFTIDQSPRYLHGLTSDPRITLGASDHSDAAPGKESRKIANLGDGSWELVAEEDLEYARNQLLQIKRFPGKMSAAAAKAPKDQGGSALVIHLGEQEKDRGVMPFYTTLRPRKPIPIAGKASHLGLWVHAASDWGRVVYVVRDAKGEKWVSVGVKEGWNGDDIHGWSAFGFDGWRYLRFQLPASAPYDNFRERGTSWWGSYGGDGVVDLPLRLEKVIVERRPKVIYGNDLVPAKPDDVFLGDLYAEYADAADRRDEAIRLSRLRMPTPRVAPELANPIAELARTGVGAPTKVLGASDPSYPYDGTRYPVDFATVEGAKGYDVWVSPYPDGRGALKLGKAWTEPGKIITGLRPDMEFFVFVVYTDKDGNLSKPSQPLRIVLKDRR